MKDKDPEPQPIDISSEEIEALVERAVRLMPEGDADLIKLMADTLMLLSQSVDDKAQSMRRLMKMIFGHQGEKASDITGEAPHHSDEKDENADDSSTDESEAKDEKGEELKGDDDKESPPKGHGKRGADKYTGAQTVKCQCKEVSRGDICPRCSRGKVHPVKPRVQLRFTSSPPISVTKFERETLRCNTCGHYFVADLPEDVGEERFDEKAIAMVALLHYGTGTPFNRLENLQQSIGVPLPSSTQWDMVSGGAIAFYPVMKTLIELAAQGRLIHNDDTTAKILELMGKRREKKPPDPEKHKRKGMYTTGIISHCGDHRISLYCTGTHHAGENLEALLEKRKEEYGPPIQMCDGLSHNLPGEIEVILANCLAHSRRKFVEIYENFPDECRYVIFKMAKVYRVDAIARKRKLSHEDRMKFHQRHSQKPMEELKAWMTERFKNKEVEPNSGLGQAMTYAIKRWEPLTLFLREPGAPLDNNICERALKKSILTRKNSLFYLTEDGAKIGDLYMSIIHTCELEGVNPFEYLTTVMKNYDEVAKSPGEWLPWNFKNSLERADVE